MNNESLSFVPVRDIVARVRSQAALALIVGVTQQTVSGWCRKNKPLPAEHVLGVEAATGIPKEELRPDIYPRDAATVPQGGVAREGAGEDSPPSRADRTPDSLSGLSA